MAKMTITDSEDFESPPAGVYAAKCISITADEGVYGPSYKWVWELTDVLSTEDDETARDFIGEEIWGWSSQSPSTKGKFVKWAAAHLGQQMLEPGQMVDTDDFIGRTVRLTLELTRDGDTTKHKVAAIGVHKKAAKRQVVEDDDELEPVAAGSGRNRRREGDPY